MFTLKARDAALRLESVAFSPDGRHLATCGDRGEACAWDLTTREVVLRPALHFPNRTVFFDVGSADLFVLNMYTCLLTAHPLNSGAARRVGQAWLAARSPEGGSFFCFPVDTWRTLGRFALDTFKPVWQTRVHYHPVALRCSLDGRFLACGESEGNVHLLDARDGRPLHTEPPRGRGEIRAVAVAPDGSAIAWCAGANLHFQHFPSGARAHHRLGRTHFWAAAWHPSGGFFATTNGDGTVDFWDGVTGERRESFHWGQDRLPDIAFDASGDRAACCSSGGRVIVWDVDR